MKINPILFVLIVTSIFIGCNSSTKTVAESASDPAIIKNDTISGVYSHYIKLKDALVNSDSTSAKAEANELAGMLSKIPGCEKTTEIAKELGSTSDIQVQRTKFLILSADIIPVVKSTELSSGSIFVLFCPMADDGKGGYWLSANKEVRNPYYGNAMLDCGEVKEEIKTN